MSRLPLQTAETAPAAALPFIQRIIANSGYLPNLGAVLANTPVALETYLTVGEINGRGSLSLAEREIIQITAASIHGCEFCVSGHSALSLKKAGLERAEVIALQHRAKTGNARYDALVDLTRAVIVSRGNVADGELQAFLDAGYAPTQVLEVVLGVSLATLCNFTNNLARSNINPELQPFRPGVLQA